MDCTDGVSSFTPTQPRTTWTTTAGRSVRSLWLVFTLLPLLVSCGMVDGTGAAPQQKAGERVHIVGSTALLPLAAKAADLYHQQHPNVQMNAEGGGSVTGLKAVNNKQADIGDSDIYADPALYPDPNLTDHIICVVAFALIADPQIPINSLSTLEISGVFTGKISNWKNLGGPDLAITLVIRPLTSGTRAIFDKYILGGQQETGKPLSSDSSTAVLDQVAHTPGAIGYVTTVLVDHTVKAIGIDGSNATEQNIKDGKYKFWGYEHMYTLENGINATTDFLDFMQSATIQQLAKKLGYISVSDIPVSIIKTRVHSKG